MPGAIFIKRVVLHNYKSIAKCAVHLGPLTFLVGPNGSGKSNFLDSLRLVTESLTASLDHALRDRGGINEVRRRSSGHPTHFGIRIEFLLPDERSGHYVFRVGSQEKGGFEVQDEECVIKGHTFFETGECSYRVESGNIRHASQEVMPPASRDRLYLVSAAGLPEFRLLYDSLSHMGFYNLNPDEIRDLQTPDPGEVLRRDGGNLASVIGLMSRENDAVRRKITEFLSKVVPGVIDVNVKHIGKKETLEFRQQMGSNQSPWRFLAENMSDGTLRALGVLTALFQGNGGQRIPLVGIEEPEAAVHPGAAGVIRDALKTAAASTQILVTSHSPDLLDDKDIDDGWILGVENRNGETKIGLVDEAERGAIRDRLYTAGELLRQGQLRPDIESIENATPQQTALFDIR